MAINLNFRMIAPSSLSAPVIRLYWGQLKKATSALEKTKLNCLISKVIFNDALRNKLKNRLKLIGNKSITHPCKYEVCLWNSSPIQPSSNCSGFGQTVDVTRQVLSHGFGVPKGYRAMQHLPNFQHNINSKHTRGWDEGHCTSITLAEAQTLSSPTLLPPLCPYPTAYGLGTRAVRLSGMREKGASLLSRHKGCNYRMLKTL